MARGRTSDVGRKNTGDRDDLIKTTENPLCDEEGFLCERETWTEAFARQTAQQEGIQLTPAHWEIIYLAQSFYSEFSFAPSMRPLVKSVADKLGLEKGRSIYLMQLFPPSPAKLAAKIAGLPKPKNCL